MQEEMTRLVSLCLDMSILLRDEKKDDRNCSSISCLDLIPWETMYSPSRMVQKTWNFILDY
jgi:hypothetical protein